MSHLLALPPKAPCVVHPCLPSLSILSLMSLFIIISLFSLSAGQHTNNGQTIAYSLAVVCLDNTPVPASVHIPAQPNEAVLQNGTITLLIGRIFIPPCGAHHPIMINVVHAAPFPGEPSNPSEYAANLPNFHTPIVIGQGTVSTISSANSGSTIAFALAVSDYVHGRVRTSTIESVSLSLFKSLLSTVQHSVQLPPGEWNLRTHVLPYPSHCYCFLPRTVRMQFTMSPVERCSSTFPPSSRTVTTIPCRSSLPHALRRQLVKLSASPTNVSLIRSAHASHPSSCRFRRCRTRHVCLLFPVFLSIPLTVCE